VTELAGRRATFVQSLDRGLAVVRAFAGTEPLTPSEAAAATGLTRAAARRFLLTLAELGYVRADARAFRLSPRVLELGRAYLSGLALPEAALPHLRALVADVRESSSLAVLDGDDVVYVAHVPSGRVLSVSVTVGGRDPAAATSLGRALLAARPDEELERLLAGRRLRRFTPRTIVDPARLAAELRRVRRQGYALVDQELEEGLRALAVPVRNRQGSVVAAANLSPHASRWSAEAVRARLLPRLREAVAGIERDLRAAPPRPPAARPGLPPGREARSGGRRPDFVQSLERGFAVIRAFEAADESPTLSEIALASGLTRAAARRFLLTLVELGYVRAEGRSFRLSPRVLELGRAFLSGLGLPELVLPHLRELVADVRESSSVAVLDGDDIVYVAHVPARRVLTVTVAVGARDPAAVTSLGRVLLAAKPPGELAAVVARGTLARYTSRTIVDPARLAAELERVRRQGWSLVDQEFEEGLRALSAPVRDRDGNVVAAANVSVYASRWSVEAIRAELLPRLLRTVSAIEDDLAAAGLTSHDLARPRPSPV